MCKDENGAATCQISDFSVGVTGSELWPQLRSGSTGEVAGRVSSRGTAVFFSCHGTQRCVRLELAQGQWQMERLLSVPGYFWLCCPATPRAYPSFQRGDSSPLGLVLQGIAVAASNRVLCLDLTDPRPGSSNGAYMLAAQGFLSAILGNEEVTKVFWGASTQMANLHAAGFPCAGPIDDLRVSLWKLYLSQSRPKQWASELAA